MADAAKFRAIVLEDVDEMLFHEEHDERNDIRTVEHLRKELHKLRCCPKCHFVKCECVP